MKCAVYSQLNSTGPRTNVIRAALQRAKVRQACCAENPLEGADADAPSQGLDGHQGRLGEELVTFLVIGSL